MPIYVYVCEVNKLEESDERFWIHCPVCGGKTRVKIAYKTLLVNFPLFCPKCRQEYLVDVFNLKMRVHKAPVIKEGIKIKGTAHAVGKHE